MSERQAAVAELRHHALSIYANALRQVEGRKCTAEALRADNLMASTYVVAIGKAAAAMTLGARDVLGDMLVAALVITKTGHRDPALHGDVRITQLEAEHPVPGAGSLAAGKALLEFLAAAPVNAQFLFLISGGASSLVEVLPAGVDLASYQRVNQWLLGSGWDIHRMNRVRRRLSCIKGGRLVRYLKGRATRCLLISDVPGDDPASIGSGLLVTTLMSSESDSDLPDWLGALINATRLDEAPVATAIPMQIVASNATAREAAAQAGQALGYTVFQHNALLAGHTVNEAHECAQSVLEGAPGIYLWGGETTIELPENPGRGGRNQSFGLAAAQVLAGSESVVLLAVGTDGTDGPGEEAGALVDGGTLARGAEYGLDADDCLDRADAGRFLAASGDLIQTGPTGTNVMDLVIAVKAPVRDQPITPGRPAE